MSEEVKETIKYLKNKNHTRRIKAITINEAQKVVEEIERLNNIIIELEKWLREREEVKWYVTSYNRYEKFINDVLDKLQELKGSDKE